VQKPLVPANRWLIEHRSKTPHFYNPGLIMGLPFYLFNIDTGDFISIGGKKCSSAEPSIGFHADHLVFPELPDLGRLTDEDGGDTGYAGNAEHIRSDLQFSHILSFFMAASVGCRLVVISADQFDDLLHEVRGEAGSTGGIGLTYLRIPDDSGAYFKRRNANMEPRVPASEAEAAAFKEKARLLREDMKATIRAGIVKSPRVLTTPKVVKNAGDAVDWNYEFGNQRPLQLLNVKLDPA
jgi:hypothetical protein